jgi:hypothetical protein
MNLHDIGPRADADTALILRFMQESAYPNYQWELDPDHERALRFRIDAMQNWEPLDSRSTLTYLNRALEWNGQPQRRSV